MKYTFMKILILGVLTLASIAVTREANGAGSIGFRGTAVGGRLAWLLDLTSLGLALINRRQLPVPARKRRL